MRAPAAMASNIPVVNNRGALLVFRDFRTLIPIDMPVGVVNEYMAAKMRMPRVRTPASDAFEPKAIPSSNFKDRGKGKHQGIFYIRGEEEGSLKWE